TEPDACGLRPDPGERGDRVRSVSLSGPHRVETESLRLENQLEWHAHASSRVSDGQSEPHVRSPFHLRCYTGVNTRRQVRWVPPFGALITTGNVRMSRSPSRPARTCLLTCA